MGLKKQVDIQIYNRERESLGTTKDVTARNISYTGQNNVQMLYKLPYTWIKKSYNFYRRDIVGRNYLISDFFDYYGAINTEILAQGNDNGISGTMKAFDNVVFSACVKSSNTNTCVLNLSAGAAIYIIPAVYYDGKWYETLYRQVNEAQISLSIPANKECIIAILMYYPGPSATNNTIQYNIGLGFTGKVDYWGIGTLPIDAPIWYSDIETVVDEKTYNLKNVLKWEYPYNKLAWDGTKVKRTLIQSSPHGVYAVPGNNIVNGIYLSSANVSSKYTPGKVLVYGEHEYTVLNTYSLKGNIITNGEFNSTAGWRTSHTVNSGTVKKSTAYAVKNMSYNNDKCIIFDMLATNTGSKTCYMETTTVIPVAEVPYTFMAHTRVAVDTSFVPYWKFLFYTTNSPSTLCSRSSATYYVNTVSSAWSQNLIYMNHVNKNKDIVSNVLMPTACTYIRPRFYACYGQKSAYKVYLDCVGLYATANQTIFNSSSGALDAVEFAEDLTGAYTNSTVDIYPMSSTSVGTKGSKLIRSSTTKFRGPYWSGGKFDGSIELFSPAGRNYIRAGDFTNSTRFRYSPGVQFLQHASSLFSGYVCYMPEGPTRQYVATTRSISDYSGEIVNLSVYAKTDGAYKKMQIIAGHSATDHRYVQEFIVGNRWKRYCNTFTWAVASASLMTKVIFSTPDAGSLYLDGFQATISNPLQLPFLTQNTAAGSVAQASLYLPDATADAVFNSKFGSISFDVAFANSSEYYSVSPCNLLNKTNGTSKLIEINYNYTTKQLVLQIATASINYYQYHTCAFSEFTPFNVSLLWDTANFYFGYNGKLKTLQRRVLGINGYDLYFGGAVTVGKYSDCYISNIKIDTARWDNTVVTQQAQAIQYTPSQYSGGLQAEDFVIYDVPRAGQSNPVVFEDQNIVPLETYKYALQHYDGQFYGPESVATSVYVYPPVPNKPVKTGYHSAESSIEFYWEHSSIGTVPYYYYVYTNTDNNLKSPLKVFKQTGVATSTYVMKDITHSAFITLRVLPVNRWDLYDTAKAAQIQGRANPASASRNLLYNSGIDFYFGTNVYDWATANPYRLGRYGDVSNNYYYKYGSTVGDVSRGRSVICCDSAAGLPLKFCGFEQVVTLTYGTAATFTYSHYSHSAYGTQHFASAVYVEWRAGAEYINSTTYKLRYRESSTGDDGRTWKRYSTTFAVNKTASVTAVLIRPRASSASGAYSVYRRSYVDSPQLELGNTMSTWEWTLNREYVEPPFNPGGGIVFPG